MKKSIIIIAAAIIVGAGIVFLVRSPGKAGTYDTFAQCIKDSGTLFYGAFWCPHCRDQKAEFGKSAELLPYIECSTPDGQSQNATCNAMGIKSYPTWVGPDHSTTSGVLSLEALSQMTNCPLPGASAPETATAPAGESSVAPASSTESGSASTSSTISSGTPAEASGTASASAAVSL